MKYGRAFVKLCLVLILCLGLGASVAYAQNQKTTPAPTTLQCGARDACRPAMEAWCYQNKTILDRYLTGKILKRPPSVWRKIASFVFLNSSLGGLTYKYIISRLVEVDVTTDEYYRYLDQVNCQQQFCCFALGVDKGLLKDFWDIWHGSDIEDLDNAYNPVWELTKSKDYLSREGFTQGYEDQIKKDIDGLDVPENIRKALKKGVDKGWSPYQTLAAMTSEMLERYKGSGITKQLWNFVKHSFGSAWESVVNSLRKSEFAEAEKNGNVLECPYILQGIFDQVHTSVDCWLCPLLEDIFVSGNAFASALYTQISKAMLALLGVFAALTIMWMVFRVLADFSGKESRAFIKKTFFLCLRVAIIAVILVQSPKVVGDLFFTPFVHLSTGLGMEVMAGTQLEVNHAHLNYFKENFNNEDSVMGCTHSHPDIWSNEQKLMFSKTTCNTLVGLVQLMSIEIATPFHYGQTLMSYAFSHGRPSEIMPKFKLFFTGLVIVIIFVVLLVAIPFKIVDIFVQLVALCALSPLAITLFAFPATRSYTKGVWKMFTSCLLQLVMVSLMVALAVAFFTGKTDDETLALFLQNRNDEAYQRIGLGSMSFLGLIALGYVAYKLLNRAVEFAEQLGSAVKLAMFEPMTRATAATTAKVAGEFTGAVAGPTIDKGKDWAKKQVDKGTAALKRPVRRGLRNGAYVVVKSAYQFKDKFKEWLKSI
ncbi:MAG: type IV secretion system protein [Alphaproteobacteria bacterium]|nr:type IV secretion system protein [Alphaproteobacteria bacterium]